MPLEKPCTGPRANAAKNHATGLHVLDRKTKSIKFKSAIIVTHELLNRTRLRTRLGATSVFLRMKFKAGVDKKKVLQLEIGIEVALPTVMKE